MCQLRKEQSCGVIPARVKLRDRENVTEEAAFSTLRRGISFYSSLQAHDGHWPAESAGPLFFIQPLVSTSSYNDNCFLFFSLFTHVVLPFHLYKL